MRRDPLPLLLILLLTVLASVAWFTRRPDSPALDWLTRQPLVGPLAERFRGAYRPAPAGATNPAAEEPAKVVVVAPGIGEPAPRAAATSRSMGRVWVDSGTRLRAAPDPGSAVVETVTSLGTMSLMERRGEWRRVSRVGLGGELSEGWVRLDELTEPTVEELWQPEPVLPLPAVAAPEEVLAEARGLMGGDARERPCGPFLLLTDVTGPLVESCPRLARQLEELYSRRLGIEPVSGAAESILLFDSNAAFLIFRTRVSPQSRRHAFASPARGFIALVTGGRLFEQVQATLAHELAHLFNRRYLGPALPSWLDEGLAEELAMSRIEADGTLVPDSLGRWEVGPAAARLVGGGEVVRISLRTTMRRGELPTLEQLVALDAAEFQAEERRRLHYSLSAFWVRYLLTDSPGTADRFRDFLSAIAAGETLDRELLLARLGAPLPELESGFRVWLDRGA